MCGEKGFYIRCIAHKVGSPPHVRGKVYYYVYNKLYNRITPACAGKSMFSRKNKLDY